MTHQSLTSTSPQGSPLDTPAWSALPLRFLGMGFYLAWIYSVQFGSAPSPTPLDVAIPEPLSLLSNVANAAALILCVIFARQLTPLIQRKNIAWAAGIAMTLGTLLLGLTGATSLVGAEAFMVANVPFALVGSVVGSLICGFGLGVIILLWGEFYASLPLRLVMIYYSASFIVATLLNFLILALGGLPALIVTALLPLISVGCCEGSARLRGQQQASPDLSSPANFEDASEASPSSQVSDTSEDQLSQKTAQIAAAARSEVTSQAQRVADTRWTFPLRPVLLMATYSFVFSYCRTTGGVVNALPMIGVAAIAAFTLIGSLWFFDRFRIEFLYRLALPFMVAGALLQPFGGDAGTAIAGIFLNAGHAGFVILVMTLFSTMCYRYGILALWLFGITRAARVIAMVVGSWLGMNAVQDWSPETLSFATVIIVIALVALSTLLLTTKDMENTWGMNPILTKNASGSFGEAPAPPTLRPRTDSTEGASTDSVLSNATSDEEATVSVGATISPVSTTSPISPISTASLTSSTSETSNASAPLSAFPVAPAPENYFDTFVGRCAQIARTHGLTPREEEVLALLAQGYSVPRIEKELFISNGTAKGHVRHIYAKMGVHTRDELIETVGVRAETGTPAT